MYVAGNVSHYYMAPNYASVNNTGIKHVGTLEQCFSISVKLRERNTKDSSTVV